MKVSTEIDNNFGYEKITQLVDNCNYPFIGFKQIVDFFLTRLTIKSYILIIEYSSVVTVAEWLDGSFECQSILTFGCLFRWYQFSCASLFLDVVGIKSFAMKEQLEVSMSHCDHMMFAMQLKLTINSVITTTDCRLWRSPRLSSLIVDCDGPRGYHHWL